MVTRIQNRNTGYSDSLFSSNPRIDNNALNSIEGATALKLDESYEINNEEHNALLDNFENVNENVNENEMANNAVREEEKLNNIPSGISIESVSYMENNINNDLVPSDETIKEYTPKLFSEEQVFQEDSEIEKNEFPENNSEQLFDQDINEEEDFEIPAFLRKQKF